MDEIVTNGGATIKTADLKNYDADAESVVYYTSEITPEALMAIYKALGVEITGENTAVKVHTGESDQSNHLRPDFIKELVQHVNGTIVESNTAYGGSRAQTAMHYQLAKDHGFTDIADVVIMDETGSLSIPVEGGSVLKENLVGARFAEFDGMLVLSHFKGHMMAASAAQSRIYLSVLHPPRASALFTPAARATPVPGAVILPRSWTPWQKPASLLWMHWTETFCLSAL